jgi:hypothetical protein
MFKKIRFGIIIVCLFSLSLVIFIVAMIFLPPSKPHAIIVISNVCRGDNWYSVDFTISANAVLDYSISSHEGDVPSSRGRVFPDSCVTGTIGFGPYSNDSLDTSEVQIEKWLLIEPNKKYNVYPGEEINLWKTENRNVVISTTFFHVNNH